MARRMSVREYVAFRAAVQEAMRRKDQETIDKKKGRYVKIQSPYSTAEQIVILYQ